MVPPGRRPAHRRGHVTRGDRVNPSFWPRGGPRDRSGSEKRLSSEPTYLHGHGHRHRPEPVAEERTMSYDVDFVDVSTVGLESSPVADALAGLRANEARYFKNKYDTVFTV